MGKKSPPEAPDPMEVAQGQTATNIGTATANSYLNNITQQGPDGSITYNVNGFTNYKDPLTGKEYKLPKWVQTTSLSPGQQKIYDINQNTSQEMAGMANEQSKAVRDILNTPIDWSNDATEKYLFDMADKRFQPQKAQEYENLRTQMANQGITEGSAAWDNSMGNFNEGWNDRYNQLALTGRQQAVQEKILQHSQPLNEIIGIMSGTQVGMPQFQQANSYGIPTTDYAGIAMDAAKMDQQNWMAQQQATSGMLGGLFGAVGSMFSDERLKENIKVVGKTNDGQKIVTYNFKGDSKPQMGLIAQDVMKKHPDAVTKDPASGFLMVDYAKALGGKKKEHAA